MSVETGDIVWIVWEIREGARGERIRKLYAVASSYAAAVVAAPTDCYEIVEYVLK